MTLLEHPAKIPNLIGISFTNEPGFTTYYYAYVTTKFLYFFKRTKRYRINTKPNATPQELLNILMRGHFGAYYLQVTADTNPELFV